MRAICQVCKDKDKCSYLANNKTRDCIDVQTSDYGYEEAVLKACKWLYKNQKNYDYINVERDVYDLSLIEDFKKYMEKEL